MTLQKPIPEEAVPIEGKPKNKKLCIVFVCILVVIAAIAIPVAITVTSTTDASSSPSLTEVEPEDFVWTKSGLEQIPWESWKKFVSKSGEADEKFLSHYVKGFPFPGDAFTPDHYDTWKTLKGDGQAHEDLIEKGYIVESKHAMKATMVFDNYKKVPTLFSDPIVLKESPLDYRLQFAADIGSKMIAESAAKGRLVNPSGRRLREHFYRFPDQCDATPIALEVFLRLMIYDQIEAFFHTKKIGLWQDLFPDVDRRFYDSEQLSVARWYGERYAESYVHKISNGWVYPLGSMQNIDTYMMAVGLDPFDDTEDHITPAGLGNVVGKRITQWMNDNDGLQRAKDFVDIEGLDRIAQYHTAQDWYHWKPTYAGSNRFQGIRNGIVTQQTFVSPSLGIKSFIYENEADFIALNLQSAVPVLNTTEESYIVKAQQFLDIQESIGDYEKAVAELSNNKISGSVFLILAYVPLLQNLTAPEQYPMMYDEFSMVTSGCAEYAATHAAWRHKRTYLAGRPKTIIRHLAATNAEFAATYPAAANFEPMIPAGDHPEYPSGSSTIYSAFAQAADNWFYDNFGIEEASKKTGKLTFTVPASKFYWQDGPSQDVTLEYEHLNAWIEELPLSRVYGGVHFLDSGVAGLNLGKEVGHSCSRLLKRLKEGDMNATYTYANREAINPFNL